MNHLPHSVPDAQRLRQIELARRAVIEEGRASAPALESLADRGWIERSWRRCLAQGQRPGERLAFDVISSTSARRAGEASHGLVAAARPVLDKLARAIANTRYFAILTDADGVVVEVNGPIDRGDRRAHLITRIGVDLSERSVGTTAIGAALAEQHPVWLHRGEHFFDDTSVYSCAGAPVFGPDGSCVGMLDVTGIEAVERPELKHLVAQSARGIENALTLARPHRLLVRLNWPGRALGGDTDALVCLDGQGWVAGCNAAARQMMSGLPAGGHPVHASELFAQPWEELFDAAGRESASAPLEVPLWSGLRVHALPALAGQEPRTARAAALPLKEVEIALIRQAVSEARGNVVKAARALGISRATVYRKLGRK